MKGIFGSRSGKFTQSVEPWNEFGVSKPSRLEVHTDLEKLLENQSAETFTFRCVDCCYDPNVFVQAMITPCLMNGKISQELGNGSEAENCYLCLLSPCFIGSYLSVGKNKIMYRKKHSIPGLKSDDYVLSCVFPWCIIMQLRNQLDEDQQERSKADNVNTKIIPVPVTGGESIVRK